MEAVKPAADATSSHANAQHRKKNTRGPVDASARARAVSSARSGVPSRGDADCREALEERDAAGSSTVPTSPVAKMTSAAFWLPSKMPLRCVQMKNMSAATDMTKADKRTATVFKVLSSWLAVFRHARNRVAGPEDMRRAHRVARFAPMPVPIGAAPRQQARECRRKCLNEQL